MIYECVGIEVEINDESRLTRVCEALKKREVDGHEGGVVILQLRDHRYRRKFGC
jgi:hypothetical protein